MSADCPCPGELWVTLPTRAMHLWARPTSNSPRGPTIVDGDLVLILGRVPFILTDGDRIWHQRDHVDDIVCLVRGQVGYANPLSFKRIMTLSQCNGTSP